MKNIKNLFNYPLIIPVLLFSIILFGLQSLPTRKALIDFFNGNGNWLTIIETFVILFNLVIYSFFYGWITNLILRRLNNEKVNLFDSLKSIGLWFPRSLIALIVGWGGIMIITFLVSQISSELIFSLLAFLTNGLWITLTFTLYPTLIASQKPILKSLIEAFSINIRSVNKWFHLLLLLFFISGGFTFLWVPEYWANRFWGMNQDYAGWMVHFQWLGGYSFQSNWYSDLTKWLFIHPPSIVAPVVMFVNILIAAFVKIRVTKILFENGYLSENSENQAETISHISTVEERYLVDKPFENINFNARVKETEFN